MRRQAWSALLSKYPGTLPQVLDDILRYGALTGYTGPKKYYISKNLKSAELQPSEISKKIVDDLALRRIKEVFPKEPGPFISSPLVLVPKPNNKWRVIHHLSYPAEESVNDFIDKDAAYLRYTTMEEVLQLVLRAGRGCTMVKRDMKDASRLIPIAIRDQWMMGFCWEGRYFVETVFPFGLRTAPKIFNLFAEAWEWILRSYLKSETSPIILMT